MVTLDYTLRLCGEGIYISSIIVSFSRTPNKQLFRRNDRGNDIKVSGSLWDWETSFISGHIRHGEY
jgi:hypothetical protein